MQASSIHPDHRAARLSLGAASVIGWPGILAWDAAFGCRETVCDPGILDGGYVAFMVAITAVLHLGLLISFAAERCGGLVRLMGAVLLAPTLVLALSVMDQAWRSLPREGAFFGLLLSLILLHGMQLWRLIDLPFPRLPTIAPGARLVEQSVLHPHAAPGTGPAAQRNAAR